LRHQAYSVVPFLFIWLFLIMKSKKKAFLHLCLLSTILLVIVSPWHIYHSVRQGRIVILPPPYKRDAVKEKLLLSKSELEKFVWPPGGYERYLVVTGKIKGKEYQEYVAAVLRMQKIRQTKSYWQRFKHLYALSSSVWPPVIFFNAPIFFLSLLGMIISWKYWRKTLFLILLLISWIIIPLWVISFARYTHPTRPYLMVFAAYAGVWIYEKIKKHRNDNKYGAVLKTGIKFVKNKIRNSNAPFPHSLRKFMVHLFQKVIFSMLHLSFLVSRIVVKK